MAELPDHLRIMESEESLLIFVRQVTLDEAACPACGSVFVLHMCGASKPLRGSSGGWVSAARCIARGDA
jgi:hypothetical protein